MNRDDAIDQLRDSSRTWDMLVIGGGATGLGVAVDAASRGYSVALVEQSDFGKGTSSRSTKLIHGGVRYLQQGNISLVREALHERTILRTNAPHLVRPLPLVLPTYRWGERTYYSVGLKMYDWLAGGHRMERSHWLSKDATVAALPTINADGLRGGVQYSDGQFDDARLLINLAQTAAEQGAAVANHVCVTRLQIDSSGKVHGATACDEESGEELPINARVVVNATGPFVDGVRRMADAEAEKMIAPSQGIHLVLDRSFLPGDSALLVPKTSDGRVLFVIPWHTEAGGGVVLAGTTDTPIDDATLEPRPQETEIEFVLETLGQYLTKKPNRDDIRSTFAGIRPLVTRGGGGKNTSKLSRDHTIDVSTAGLLTITGGKWTTYRNMAEDCVDRAAELGDLPNRECRTKQLKIHGYQQVEVEHANDFGPRWYYGADASAVNDLAQAESLDAKIHPDFPFRRADIVWAVRHEMARTVDDILARRTRALLLDARSAIASARQVAQWMAEELNRDSAWVESQVDAFEKIAAGYK